MILEAKNLSFAYGDRRVLSNVNLRLEPGITAIIGPNAVGKSTLLKCLSGWLRPQGEISLDGRSVGLFHREELARKISYLPQDTSAHASMTVFEAVLMGRIHQLSWRVSQTDIQSVEQLLDEMGLIDVANRGIDELSGGQLQMVFIAQAIAREPDVLLMDEPTSNLDIQHQFQICEWVHRLTLSRTMSTVMAVHDLNIAARFADQVCVLQNGGIFACGSAASVITTDMIASVYSMEAVIGSDECGRPLVTPLRTVTTRKTQ